MTTTLTNSSPLNKRSEFEALVFKWENRRRLQKLIFWLPRILALALGVGIAVLLLLYFTGLLAGSRMVIAAGIVMAGIVIMGMLLALRSRPVMEAVRQFDLDFHLQERVSTALELLSGRIQTGEELAAYQLEDAYATARQIDPKTKLKFAFRPLEWGAVVLLVGLFLLTIWATGVFAASSDNTLSVTTTQAVEEAADDLRNITEDVATETALTPEEREALLETLETGLNNLEDVPLTAEQAFAAVTEVEQQLREQAAAMRDALQAQQDAYNAAAERLQDSFADNNTSESDTFGLGDSLENMLEELVEGADTDSMAEALQNAANALANTDPALAESLRNAAFGLENENITMSEESLREALDQLEQNEATMSRRAEAASELEQSADETRSAAESIASSELEATEGEPNASEDSSTGETREGAPQEGAETGAGESESQNSQAGAPSDNQQTTGGNNSGGQSSSGDPQLSDQGNASVPGESSNPGESGENVPSNNGSTGGAGDMQSNNSSSAGGSASQNNNPDGLGESEYESIYAPRGIDAEGTSNIVLEPDSGDMPVAEGNFQDNPAGESRVPYNQVFQQYADAVSRALSSDYIPLSLRDIVQDYFTSLEPEQE